RPAGASVRGPSRRRRRRGTPDTLGRSPPSTRRTSARSRRQSPDRPRGTGRPSPAPSSRNRRRGATSPRPSIGRAGNERLACSPGISELPRDREEAIEALAVEVGDLLGADLVEGRADLGASTVLDEGGREADRLGLPVLGVARRGLLRLRSGLGGLGLGRGLLRCGSGLLRLLGGGLRLGLLRLGVDGGGRLGRGRLLRVALRRLLRRLLLRRLLGGLGGALLVGLAGAAGAALGRGLRRRGLGGLHPLGVRERPGERFEDGDVG